MQEEMGAGGPSEAFEPQARNYGNSYKLVVSKNDDPTPDGAGESSEEGMPLATSSASGGGLGESTLTEDEVMASLFEVKKKKKKTKSVFVPKVAQVSFEEYAAEILGGDDAKVQGEIARAKELFDRSGFPLMRFALHANTMNCIRVVFYQVFHETFAETISKKELVSRCLVCLQNRLLGEYDSVKPLVGDFGVVKEECAIAGVKKGEVVLLKVNSVDNTGADCVAGSSWLLGWVLREGKAVEVEVEERNLRWGELYLHKKVSVAKKE
jgi:hypothetical protein